MSDDASYASFLDKANQDSSTASASSQSKSKYSTNSVNTSVPSSLQDLSATYISDTDAPFEPVSLKWTGSSLPDAKQLGELIGHSGEVETVEKKDFDLRSQYKEVLEKAKEVGDGGEVRVYRVVHGSTRAEYYVVSLDKKGGRVVGVKAMAVES